MQVFGERLQAMREAHRLTLRDLSERSGIPHTVISNFETGRRLPSLEHLALLAVALEVDPVKLLPRRLTEIVTPFVRVGSGSGKPPPGTP